MPSDINIDTIYTSLLEDDHAVSYLPQNTLYLQKPPEWYQQGF